MYGNVIIRGWFYISVLCVSLLPVLASSSSNPYKQKFYKKGSIIVDSKDYSYMAQLEVQPKLSTVDGCVVVKLVSQVGRASVRLLTGPGGSTVHNFNTLYQERDVAEGYVWTVNMYVSGYEQIVNLDDGYNAWVKFAGKKRAVIIFPAYTVAVKQEIYEADTSSETSPGKLLDTVRQAAGETLIKEYIVESGMDLYVWTTYLDGPDKDFKEVSFQFPNSAMSKYGSVTGSNVVTSDTGAAAKASGTVGSTATRGDYTGASDVKYTTTAGDTDGARDSTLVKIGNGIGENIRTGNNAILTAINKQGAAITAAIGSGSGSGSGSGTSTDLTGVISGISGVNSAVTGVASQVSGVRTEVAGLRTDIGGIKTSIDANTTAVSGLSTDLDGIKESVDAMKDDVHSTAEQAKYEKSVIESIDGVGRGMDGLKSQHTQLINAAAGVGSAASTYGQSGQTAGDTLVSYIPIAPEIQEPSSSVSASQVSMDVGTGSPLTVSLNPFDQPGTVGQMIRDAAAFIRRLVAWSIVAWFFVWLIKRLSDVIQGGMQVTSLPNALAQSIDAIKIMGFGGGFGYSARLIGIVTVMAVVVTMPMAILATVQTGLPWEGLTTAYSAGLGGYGGISDALAYANMVVPWVMLVSTPIYYIIVNTVLLPSQIFWAFFMKFLPL
jgi:hypothetical protein